MSLNPLEDVEMIVILLWTSELDMILFTHRIFKMIFQGKLIYKV